jgi:hypothetical protein
MSFLLCSVILGFGATAFIDLWSILRVRLFKVAPPNFGLVGRWLVHCSRGRFHHQSIAASAQINHELIIGWIAHYVIGTVFAGLLLLICGVQWLQHPTIPSALAVGFVTVLAPFFIMQPGMGAGIAASRMPRPNPARLQSLITHGLFGVGLYITARAIPGFCLAT